MQLLQQIFYLKVFCNNFIIEALYFRLLESVLILKFQNHRHQFLVFSNHLPNLILKSFVLPMKFRVLLIDKLRNRKHLVDIAVFRPDSIILTCPKHLIQLQHQIINFLLLLFLNLEGFLASVVTLEDVVGEAVVFGGFKLIFELKVQVVIFFAQFAKIVWKLLY